MHSPFQQFPFDRTTISVAFTLLAFSGCALLDTGGWTAAGLGTVSSSQTRFKPIGETVPDAMELEYVLIERPVGDPLLGDLLWDELDQIGSLRPDKRKELADHGFRVGVSFTNGPDALQKLMGNTQELLDHTANEEARKHRGHRLLLRSGGQTEAQTSETVEERRVRFELAGDTVDRTFEQARCLFRVTARSDQEGWATFEFLPEIHYGSPRLRPVADEASWQLRTGQEIQKLFNQRFEIKLQDGEMAVITNIGSKTDCPGVHFFRDSVDGVPVQRVLVVRLVKAKQNSRSLRHAASHFPAWPGASRAASPAVTTAGGGRHRSGSE